MVPSALSMAYALGFDVIRSYKRFHMPQSYVHDILQFDWFASIPGKGHNAINNVLPDPFPWVGSGA